MGLFGKRKPLEQPSLEQLGLRTPKRGIKMTHLDVVGEASYQKHLRAIRSSIDEGSWFGAWLVREPGNPYDTNAVKVTAYGNTIGYLPKPLARKLASKIDADGGTWVAVAKLTGGTPQFPHIGVHLMHEDAPK